MSQNQDIFDFDVDVFQQPEQQKSPLRQQQPPIIEKQKQLQQKPSSRQSQPQMFQQKSQKQKQKKVINRFSLNDQQKINISKRLPKGFVLLKRGDFPDNFGPFKGDIEYIPVKKDPKIASEQLLEKFSIAVLNTMNPKKDTQKKLQKPGLRLSSGQLPQGKSKQTQKVKGVLQKFRKHPKYPQLAQQLNKLGLMQGFTQIESQIKKNIHTIDSFKDRCLYIMNQAKLATFSQTTSEVINELIDEFMFQIQQAKKLQFDNNLLMIQKNIDKITREITDIRESGNWYLRKKKRTEKNFDQKEVMYIADLVRSLPPAYLVGVWEIVEERPFLEAQQKEIVINFSQLKTKKIREIESYVKRKHNTYLTSRQRKKEKLKRKQELSGDVKSEKLQSQLSLVKKEQKIEQEREKDVKVEDKDNLFVGDNDLESFLSVEDIQKKEEKKQHSIFEQDNKSYLPQRQKMQQVDDFLELDELFQPQDKIQYKNNEESKVPPTPRFSSLDNNPHIDEETEKKMKLKNEEEIEEEKEVQQFQMEEPDLRIPQPIDGDSSDSSFITDDQDSDY